ncbi:MAG: cupin domain-containing protein [Bacteroidota bacterium]
MAVIDLNSTDSKQLIPGLHFKFIHSENMTVSFVDIDAGADLPEHSHPHEQITIVKKGTLELIMDGEKHVLEPGSVIVIPSHAVHSAKAITACEAIDVFNPVREDFK